jgi:hypothetical protein
MSNAQYYLHDSLYKMKIFSTSGLRNQTIIGFLAYKHDGAIISCSSITKLHTRLEKYLGLGTRARVVLTKIVYRLCFFSSSLLHEPFLLRNSIFIVELSKWLC